MEFVVVADVVSTVGILGSFILALIGAVILLALLRLFTRGSARA